MNEKKRKRNQDQYSMQSLTSTSQVKFSPNTQEQVLVIENRPQSQQFLALNQAQLINGFDSNSSQNMLYLLMPVNSDKETVPNSVVALPKNDDGMNVRYVIARNSDPATQYTDDNSVFIKDEPEIKSEILPTLEEDPLQEPTVTNSIMKTTSVTAPALKVSTKFYPLKDHYYTCDHINCMKQFSSLTEKKAHLDDHMFPKSTHFKCNICSIAFDTATDRNKHVEAHAVVNTFKCTCDKSFPYYTSLLNHAKETGCIPPKIFTNSTCEFCGIQYSATQDLKSHQKAKVRTCVCHFRSCKEHAYEQHISLCHKHHNRQIKWIQKKSKFDDVIIVLD